MFFYLSKLAAPFTDPIAIVYVILATSVMLGISGRARWAWRGIGIALGLMTLVMFTPLDYWLWMPLENRFPLPLPPACVEGLVVLSGGEEPSESARRGIPLLEGAPMRYVELSELMRRYPAAKVIFSGGVSSPGPHPISEADVAKGIMAKLQLDTSRVRFESQSRTTWENAVDAKLLAQPKSQERWLLLAPAHQMPRAVGSFRKIGWDVLPWPTDYAEVGPRWWSRNPIGHFRIVDAAEHQWLGLFAYWLTGRSSELFPGPSTDMSSRDVC
jgi:uncharacterized SAM-binding protein YcdF (DUF218 family)